jgi:hypothetical protein
MSRFLTRFGRNRFSPTPCFAYDAESALPRNVHPIPITASLPSASLCTPSMRCLPPERRLPLTPSDSPVARIAREEAEGLELDGHGEEAMEPVHRDTRVERLDGGATGLYGGSGASVERKRRARRRELQGSTAGAKLRWRARPLPPPWASARQASLADLLPRRQAHPWRRPLRVVSFLPSSRIHDQESG